MSAASPGVFDSIRDAAVRKYADPIECETGPGTIAHKSLAALVMIGFDAHRGLYVEPIELRRHRPAVLRFEKARSTAGQGDHIPFSGMVSDGPVRGFSARGWLGQFLVVFPKARIVAVRMRAPERIDYSDSNEGKNGYRGFADDVGRLF